MKTLALLISAAVIGLCLVLPDTKGPIFTIVGAGDQIGSGNEEMCQYHAPKEEPIKVDPRTCTFDLAGVWPDTVYTSGEEMVALFPGDPWCLKTVISGSSKADTPFYSGSILYAQDEPLQPVLFLNGPNCNGKTPVQTYYGGLDFFDSFEFTSGILKLSDAIVAGIGDSGGIEIVCEDDYVFSAEGDMPDLSFSCTQGMVFGSDDRRSLLPYTLVVNRGDSSTEIVKDGYYESEAPRMLWAGDLDGDNLPDVLMDISNKDCFSYYILYFSALAPPGDAVGFYCSRRCVGD